MWDHGNSDKDDFMSSSEMRQSEDQWATIYNFEDITQNLRIGIEKDSIFRNVSKILKVFPDMSPSLPDSRNVPKFTSSKHRFIYFLRF